MTPTVTRLLPAALTAALIATGLGPAHAQLPNHWEESGQASYYSNRFDGGRTASGATFDQRALTAAHSALPIGSRILVTMQETGRAVVVTITDRMPARHVRVIDLSRAAAARLGLIARGVGMVTISQAPADAPIEVAEAPDDDEDLSSPPRGRRHTRHVARTAAAHHACCHAPSASQARH